MLNEKNKYYHLPDGAPTLTSACHSQPNGSRESIATRLLGQLGSMIAGGYLVKCPGEHLHTNGTENGHCCVYLDKVPTVHCMHQSCRGAVDDVNHKLRSQIGKAEYSGKNALAFIPAAKATWIPPKRVETYQIPVDEDALAAEDHAVTAEAALTGILKSYKWDLAGSAPISNNPDAQFDIFVERLWLPSETIWIGAVQDSGSYAAWAFAPAEMWKRRGLTDRGVQTNPCVFKPGSVTRSNSNVLNRKYLVFESDTLTKSDQATVINYIHREMGLQLLMIVDSGSKSLHGWFEAEGLSGDQMTELKAVLTGSKAVCQTPTNPTSRGWHRGFQGDPAMFIPSQPIRLPGPINPKTGNRQTIAWLAK